MIPERCDYSTFGAKRHAMHAQSHPVVVISWNQPAQIPFFRHRFGTLNPPPPLPLLSTELHVILFSQPSFALLTGTAGAARLHRLGCAPRSHCDLAPVWHPLRTGASHPVLDLVGRSCASGPCAEHGCAADAGAALGGVAAVRPDCSIATPSRGAVMLCLHLWYQYSVKVYYFPG